MNIFDTVGTLVGLASKTGIMEEDGQIPHVKEAMMSDAIGTTVGSMMGSSTITTYVESASGIAEGGRSGFTSLVTGVLFCLLCSLLPVPADSECGNDGGFGTGRGVYDGFYHKSRYG